jgi:branched-chain amino acid transport system substrate-binding protein
MRVRGRVRWLASLAALIAVAALAWTGAGPSAGEDILKVGAPLAVTGATAREGALTKQGYDLWAETVNAHGGMKVGGTSYKVQIVYYDDQSKPQASAELAERLISQDRVSFLLGPYGSPATFADAAIAERHQMPMIDAEGAADKIFQQGYKYTFGLTSPASEYGPAILKMAITVEPRPQTVAILSADDLFSIEVGDATRAWAEHHGLKVVYFQKYPVGVRDLSPALTSIKSLRPDVIIGSGHLEESLLVMKEAKSLDLNAKFYGFTVGPTTPDFVKALGQVAEYVVSSSQWTEDVKYSGPVFGSAQDYARLFEQKYGFTPDYHAASASAGGLALQLALEKAGTLDPENVRAALAALDAMTFYGRIKFTREGLNIYKPMVDIQIQHGKAVTVWPADIAPAKLLYPTPAWSARR